MLSDKKIMNIAIIGTRGIPNRYGGFEQFAEYLSEGLVKSGHRVTVYNSHLHPYQESFWRGVKIIHCYDAENKLGTTGQFIYDLMCIVDTRKRNFDIILQLGYTSSTIWGRLLPRKKVIVTTNMDGLEWKRSKYSKVVRHFLLYAEKLAIKYSDYLIADSLGIQQYLKNKYDKDAVFIPYGANVFNQPNATVLNKYQLTAFRYNMLIARLEPENNIETILDGTMLQTTSQTFLVIGNSDTNYGEFLKKKYAKGNHIRFLNGIYNMEELNNLRYYSNLYFHGHSVGGTNPSLLEAMASQSLVCAHDNIFNKSVLENDGYYFSSVTDVAKLLTSVFKEDEAEKLNNNILKIETKYSWDAVIHQYLRHFKAALEG